MNFYIHENVNRLSRNSYIEELFIKGRLQIAFENNTGYEGNVYKEIFEKNFLKFVSKFNNLHFNDFLFMHGVPINSPTAKIVLMLLKYGSECLIYVDRSVLRWLYEGDIEDTLNKDQNLQRKLKAIEIFIDMEFQRLKIHQPKYSRIEKATKDGHIVNMAFNRFTRYRNPYSNLSGTLVEVNFFFTKILPKINSKNANDLMENVINIFKANNDYCTYLFELQRLETVKLFYMSSRLSRSSNGTEEDDDDYDIQNFHNHKYHPDKNEEPYPKEIFQNKQMISSLPNSYESLVAEAIAAAKTDSKIPENTDLLNDGNNNNNYIDDDDSDDSDLDPDNLVVDNYVVHASALGGYANGEDGDIFKNGRDFDITCGGMVAKKEIFVGTFVYFIIKSTMSQRRDVLKQTQKIISSVCLPSEVSEKYCILLYYNVSKKVYHLMTRQIKTARGVIIQQTDILICGWSGINKNVNKTLLLKHLKSKNNEYNVKKTQIYDCPPLDRLRKDLLEIILELGKIEQKTVQRIF